MIQALRQVLRSGWVDRFVVGDTRHASFSGLLERADDRIDRPYRVDAFHSDYRGAVLPWEAILVVHFDAIDDRTGQLNRRGRRVTHWLLGGSIEVTPGRWPFMHDYSARAFAGPEGLTQWLSEMRLNGPSHPPER